VGKIKSPSAQNLTHPISHGFWRPTVSASKKRTGVELFVLKASLEKQP